MKKAVYNILYICAREVLCLFCQVIVDIAHENVAQAFTYAIPDGMNLTPGQRVQVPF